MNKCVCVFVCMFDLCMSMSICFLHNYIIILTKKQLNIVIVILQVTSRLIISLAVSLKQNYFISSFPCNTQSLTIHTQFHVQRFTLPLFPSNRHKLPLTQTHIYTLSSCLNSHFPRLKTLAYVPHTASQVQFIASNSFPWM